MKPSPLRPHESLNRNFVSGEIIDFDFDMDFDDDLVDLPRVLGIEIEERKE